ncbi:MAG: DUF11 domain-containing protein, partial [Chloroflexota bacterium]
VWQYSMDDGGSWTGLAPVSESTARLMASDAKSRLRFVPDDLWHGEVDPGITFRAWDQTSGTNGAAADVTANGGKTAYSTAAETARILINDQANLKLEKSTLSGVALSGSTVPYTLTVTNQGPAPASGVIISDTLPAGLTYASGPAGCSLSDGVVICSVGDLEAGETAVRTIQAGISAQVQGLVTNQALVYGNQPDLDLDDNQAQAGLLVQASSQVYTTTFDGQAGGEWSDGDVTTPLCGSSFLGEFGNQTVSMKLGQETPLAPHSRVLVTFDLYILRSWDGNTPEWQVSPDSSFAPSLAALGYAPGVQVGPDQWIFSADGKPLLNTTFANWNTLGFRQAYPGSYPGGDYPAQTGAQAINSLCYDFGGHQMDSRYPMTFLFKHSGPSLELDFSAMGLQDITDESWGLDNLQVTLLPSPVGTVYLPLVIR